MLTFRDYILIYKSVKKVSNKKSTQNINRARKKIKLSMRGRKLQILNDPKTQNSYSLPAE